MLSAALVAGGRVERLSRFKGSARHSCYVSNIQRRTIPSNLRNIVSNSPYCDDIFQRIVKRSNLLTASRRRWQAACRPLFKSASSNRQDVAAGDASHHPFGSGLCAAPNLSSFHPDYRSHSSRRTQQLHLWCIWVLSIQEGMQWCTNRLQSRLVQSKMSRLKQNHNLIHMQATLLIIVRTIIYHPEFATLFQLFSSFTRLLL